MKRIVEVLTVLTLVSAMTPVNARTTAKDTPQASLSQTVSKIGNTSDGSMGRLSIGSYSAKLYSSSSQSTVDAADSAAYMDWGTKVLIADHASQGFSVIRTSGAGTVGTITDNSSTTYISMASSYQGYNTGNGINLNDGRYAENVSDGYYILYTCNDSSGYSVTVTYWNEIACPYTTPTAETSGAVPMYRLYNPNSGEHFYTGAVSERDHLISLGWNYENLGWYAPSSGNAVYRLYNPNSGMHHYTMAASERDNLVSYGWNYEGVGWYSDPNQTVPVYRQYNPNNPLCLHNYTTNVTENNHLVSIGWNYEGIGWYGVN